MISPEHHTSGSSPSLTHDAVRLIRMLTCTSLGVSSIYLIGGAWSGRLVLLGEGVHNLADTFAYAVALYIEIRSKAPANDLRLPFGTRRIETLGGFFSGVFLLTSALFIWLEWMERVLPGADAVNSGSPWFAIVIGSVGLTVNGLVLYFNRLPPDIIPHLHSHGHGPQSIVRSQSQSNLHSHELDARTYSMHQEAFELVPKDDVDDDLVIHSGQDGHIGDFARLASGREQHSFSEDTHFGRMERSEFVHEASVNVHGAFTHALVDMSTSFLVILSGIVSYLLGKAWYLFVDSLASIAIISIILSMAKRVLAKSGYILLLATPSDYPVDRLRSQLCALRGVREVNDVRVFPITGHRDLAGIVHLRCSREADVEDLVHSARVVLKSNQITYCAIEPTF